MPIEDVHIASYWLHHIREQAANDQLGRNQMLGCGIDFDSIAGSEQQRLGTARFFQEQTINLRVAGESLPGFNIGSVMADSNAKKIH